VAGLIALRAAKAVLRRGQFQLLAAEGSAVAYRMFEPGGSTGGSTKGSTEGSLEAGLLVGGSSPSGAGGSVGGGSIGRSMVVAVNAGDEPARLCVNLPDLAGATAEQVTWSGLQWETIFAPESLERGTLAIDLEAREGVAIELMPAR
jgi:hypothetical protein